ncbi:hypothetical protein EYB25_001093 [Talaromyces marneffei]|uniref:Uncharacterized protein n=2 Tax=Talaromyces marneffei TaxID=37727 RepID=B6Q261_TALMQ|nr:uncharacterized protein EYB26_001239 [Talaromyces marneffei]EEA27943.1 conserved hypothetical protein [Talaromyces marneffei ATCC 18224]KAE8556392.1 hypothetical protein EYB25_001093 [Talaromyces marneffei]QGA13589.1 hypothetical protein EYB26_001239 [Talaromyces marneffei]
MALSQRIPILLCGKMLSTGVQVTELLKPEFEVIQFINSFDYAKAEFGNLLAGKPPQTPSANDVGTHDYTQPLRAIMFGRGYSFDQVNELYDMFKGQAGRPIAWIVGDPEFKLPLPLPPDYAVIATENTKMGFRRWEEAGGNKEEIVLY